MWGFVRAEGQAKQVKGAGMPDEAGQIDALFAEWNRPDSPGCALGVIQEGDVVYARGCGMANLDLGVPITPASVFHVASVSKQFTAITAALLAAEGKLSLHDDIRKYVPELPDLGHRIRLRHLILHTSGLRDQYALFDLAGWRDDDVQSFEDVMDFVVRHRRLNFQPGSEYSYCNTSYTLLALTIERVSGQPFAKVVRSRIFEPLDMTHSHFHDDHTLIVPGRARGYAPRDGGGFKVADSNVSAVGAICLYTSVEDLLRWVGNFRERRVAGQVMDAAMTPGVLNDGLLINYGFGLTLGAYRGLRVAGHGGVDSGYRAQVLWFPEADFGVIVLANLSTIKPLSLARRVADLYLTDRLGSDDLLDAPAVALPEAELAAAVDLYRDGRTGLTRRVQLEDGKLTVNGGFGERLEMVPLGAGRFRVGDPPYAISFAASADGGTELREIVPESREPVFAAVGPATPTADDLAAYAGTYSCPDLGVTYTFLVREGGLVLRRRKLPDSVLEPTVRDAFSEPQFDYVFTRDSRGDVSGFDVFAERIRYLRFERMG